MHSYIHVHKYTCIQIIYMYTMKLRKAIATEFMNTYYQNMPKTHYMTYTLVSYIHMSYAFMS